MSALALCLLLTIGVFNCSSLSAQGISFPSTRSLIPQNPAHKTAATNTETWTSILRENWDGQQNAWQPWRREFFTRDLQNRVTEHLHQEHDNTGFFTTFRLLNTYNGPGEHWDEQIAEIWNGTGWDLSERYLEAHDSLGNLTLRVQQIWNGNAWDTTFAVQWVHTYNGSGQLTESIKSLWNSSTGLQNNERRRYSYNTAQETDTIWADEWNAGWQLDYRWVDLQWHNFSQNLLASETQQRYLGIGYLNDVKVTHDYGPNGKFIYKNYNWTGFTWEPAFMDSSLIDPQGNRTLIFLFQYQNNAWSLISGDSIENDYRPDLQPLTFLFRDWDPNEPAWNERSLVTYNYTVLNRPEPKAPPTFILFPQPLTDQLQLLGEQASPGSYQLAIYDAQGRSVAAWTWEQNTNNPRHNWDLSRFQSGLYTYLITGDQYYQSGTLIKK